MTTVAASAPRPFPIPQAILRYWRGILVVTCILLSSGYSLYRLGAFALSDTPLGFLIFVPFIAALMFLRLGTRPRDPHEPKRDLFSDGVFSLPFFMVALFLLLVLPTQQSWYYWLNRFDLLAVPIMAAGLIILFWGMPSLKKTWPALAYLSLVWPGPMLGIQQRLASPLTELTAIVTGLLVRLTNLPIAIDEADRRFFAITGADGSVSYLAIGDACSGLNAILGFLLLGVPIALMFRGSWTARGLWLAVGVGIAFISNVVRSYLILFSAVSIDFSTAIQLIHPVLGVVTFAVTIIVMLLLAQLFRLRWATLPAGSLLPWQHDKAKLPRNLVFATLGFSLFLGVLNVDLVRFGSLDVGTLPSVRASTPAAILPELPGWKLEPVAVVDWRSIFGINSRAEIFDYNYRDELFVGVQVVMSPDKRLLDSYSIENCRLFHLDEVIGVRDVDLGNGLTGRLVQTLPDEGPPQTILYFIVPVIANEQAFNARIALFFNSDDVLPPQLFEQARSSAATQLQTNLNSSLGRFGTSGEDPRFTAMNRFAVGMGTVMVERIAQLRAG